MHSDFIKRVHQITNRPEPHKHLVLGHSVLHGQLRADQPVLLSHHERPEHIAILGKTGTGKSSLLRFLCEQDIRDDRGFVFFDLHGDATPALARLIAAEEQRRGESLAHRLVVFDPSDREYSVGINILEATDPQQAYVQLAEVTQILRDRWRLEVFGARTEELLRNSLHVLFENRMTIVELGPLLTDSAFRAALVEQTKSAEPRTYFTERYSRLSPAAQAEYREAVLNKVTVFTADPHFRHLLGQTESSLNLRSMIDAGCWLVFNLDKGQLGEQAVTLGSLLLTRLKHTLFGRKSSKLVTVYCDELQNLVTVDRGIDTLFAEARKLGVSITSANQYLDQYSPSMQAAVMAVGTLCFFQLSGFDAKRIAEAHGHDAILAQHLRDLPSRQMIIMRPPLPPAYAGVPNLADLTADPAELLNRSRLIWATRRDHIEEEIALRVGVDLSVVDPLDGWE
jgi:Cdc6-like AAA superfamily ATPase